MSQFNLTESKITSPIFRKGNFIIEANAGTGKTYTIEGMVLRLILEGNVKIENILVVTFTNKATAELKERIFEKLQLATDLLENKTPPKTIHDPVLKWIVDTYRAPNDVLQFKKKLDHALGNYDEASILSIHGFCHKTLSNYALESNISFDFDLLEDEQGFIEEISQDFWRGIFYQNSMESVALLKTVFLKPEVFRPLFQTIDSKHQIKLLPEKLKGLEPEGILDGCLIQLEKIKRLWEDGAQVIKAIMENKSNILNARSYSPNSSCNKIKAMEQFVALNLIDQKQLSYFFQSNIQKSTKKNFLDKVPQHEIFIACEDFFQTYQPLKVSVQLSYFQYVKEKMKKKTSDKNLRSFKDMIYDLYYALLEDSKSQKKGKVSLKHVLQNKYTAVLIDEFQDTDPIQYQIFKNTFSKNTLFFIGDPKQAIYDFRGADIYAYLDGVKQADEKFELKINYRSEAGLVKAINYLFRLRNQPFVETQITYQTSESHIKNAGINLEGNQVPFELWLLEKSDPRFQPWIDSRKPNWIKRGAASDFIISTCVAETVKILKLSQDKKASIADRAIEPNDICFIVRSHQQAALVQNALRNAGVPSVIKTQESVFDSCEFLDLIRLLDAVIHPSDLALIRLVLVSEMVGLNAKELLEVDESAWDTYLEYFSHLHDLWVSDGFYVMIEDFLSYFRTRNVLLGLKGGERKLANVIHLIESLQKVESKQKLSMRNLLSWCIKSKQASHVSEETLLRLETDKEAVKVMTIHSSKGLEFSIVFCPFSGSAGKTREYFFHDEQNQLHLDLEKPEKHKEAVQTEILAEEMRLLYVALTRAKYKCYLIWGEVNGCENSALAYLLHDNQVRDKSLLMELKNKLEGQEHILLRSFPHEQIEEYIEFEELKEPKELHLETFQGKLNPSWVISSYNSLSRVETYIPEIEKDFDPYVKQEILSENKVENIFEAPLGTRMGECFHEILEKIDFQVADQKKILQHCVPILEKFQFNQIGLPQVTLEMIENILQVPLITNYSTFKLQDISPKKRISELEFYFTIEKSNSNKLKEILLSFPKHKALAATIKSLHFKTIRGYLNGFIDLVFEQEGRFYVLDWKSNFLGSKTEDYGEENMNQAMFVHHYTLQYYLYVLALHKYLKFRLPNYKFTTHFGGVFYLFLRGISQDDTNRHGIFYNSLEESEPFINVFEDFFQNTN